MPRNVREMDIEALLVNAIDRRNAESAIEIVTRKIQAGKSLVEYLHQATGDFLRSNHRNRNHNRSEESADDVTADDVSKTEKVILDVLKNIPIKDDDSPDLICRMAREMLECDPPYLGEDLDDPKKAESFIYSCAEDPQIMSKLSPKALGFWRYAPYSFRSHRSKHTYRRHGQ